MDFIYLYAIILSSVLFIVIFIDLIVRLLTKNRIMGEKSLIKSIEVHAKLIELFVLISGLLFAFLGYVTWDMGYRQTNRISNYQAVSDLLKNNAILNGDGYRFIIKGLSGKETDENSFSVVRDIAFDFENALVQISACHQAGVCTEADLPVTLCSGLVINTLGELEHLVRIHASKCDYQENSTMTTDEFNSCGNYRRSKGIVSRMGDFLRKSCKGLMFDDLAGDGGGGL